jgi:hypothetical protein
MHLVENFALAAGVKIGKPTIEPLYFPIGGEYITIHNSSGMESKNYDYYKDVVSIIKPYIKNIKIIQIGQKGERIIEGTTSLLGETSLRQAAYLLMNSKLHIGNDSFACHIAGAYETPLVALYGPTHKSTCSPFWGDKEKQALLSPDYSSRKPSWAAKEIKKRVNEIFPDNVAMHALNLLKINNKLDLIDPVHLGEDYGRSIIDVVPNFTGKLNAHKDSIINLRLDYGGDCKTASYWLSSYKCVAFINKPEHISFLKEHKGNIKRISVTLNDSFTEGHMEEIDSINAKASLSYEDEATISDMRIKFFGLNIAGASRGSKKRLDFPAKICDTTLYKSSLMLFSNGKIYPCKAALDRGKESKTEQTTIEDPSFYQQSKYFKIYNHATQSKND